MLTLVTGGAASGKSEYAEGLTLLSPGRRYYLATMRPCGPADPEFAARVARHRAMRAGKGFQTIECPTELRGAAVPEGAAVLLECLSNLAANELFGGAGEDAEREILAGIDALCRRARDVIVVSNEIFSDGVAYDSGTERYLALLGRLNREIARRAGRVVEVVCGIPIYHKGGPHE